MAEPYHQPIRGQTIVSKLLKREDLSARSPHDTPKALKVGPLADKTSQDELQRLKNYVFGKLVAKCAREWSLSPELLVQ